MTPTVIEQALLTSGLWKGTLISIPRDAEIISLNHQPVDANEYVFISDLTAEEKEAYIMLFPNLEKELRG